MRYATDLDVMHLPVDDTALWADPMAYFREARKKHPWLARTDYGLFVFGYEAISDIVYMDDKLRPNFDELVEYYQAGDTPWGRFQVEQIINRSGEAHKRIRTSVGNAFSPRNILDHLWLIRRNANALLDEWVPLGQFDFVDFASRFPISVLCGLLGTSTEEIPLIQDSLETQGRVMCMDPAIVPDLVAGYHVLFDYCDRLVREREEGRAGDSGLLDELIARKNRGQIDDTELRHLLMILFVAGYDTSKNMLALTMRMLLDRPDDRERCASDPDFCKKVVEEMFRHTSTGVQARIVTEEFEYDGVTFPAGTALNFGNSMAGRDPAGWDDPESFDPERVTDNRHVAFGRGAHICLGQHLARIQIAEMVHLMTQRMKNPHLVGEVAWRPFMGTWGLETLPIAFDPA